MRKFYSCTQGSDSVNTYAAKLEEIYSQAIELGAVPRGSDDILKQVLYQGLNIELKHVAQYKNDTIRDYDRFKIELRKLESEMKTPDTKTKPCHAAQSTAKENEKSEITELKEILKQLNEKIDQMQKEREMENQNKFERPTYGIGGRKYYRGFNSNFRMNCGQGQGDYRPRRPVGTTTFRGACHRCNQRGHMAKDCPKDLHETPSKKTLNE